MSVVRIRRSGGKIVQDCTIYIGRKYTMGGWNLSQSRWANPFTVKEYGLDTALSKYEQYIRDTPDLWNSLEELDGQTLGCWCDPIKGKKEYCHGQVLLRLL